MPSSTLPRFVLKPWEFEGAPHSPFADALAQCEWNGKTVLMRLKVRGNLLFFAPSGERDGRLFALSTPVDESEEAANKWKSQPHDLRERFERGLQTGDWARCVFIRFPSELGWNSRLPMVMALVHLDGRVWSRRLYGERATRAWVDWSEAPRFGLEPTRFCQWPHASLRRFLLSQIARELQLPLDHRLSSAEDKRRVFGPVWVKGNEQTMSLWLKLATQIFVDFNSRALERLSGRDDVNFVVHAGNAAFEPFVGANLTFVRPPSRSLLRLWKLILREHRVFGGASSHTNYQLLEGRTRFNFSVSPEVATQHERLEAMLHLRDAVRGTPIEAEVAEILKEVRLGP